MGYAVRKAMAQRASNIGGGLNPFLGSGICDLTGADRSVETKTQIPYSYNEDDAAANDDDGVKHDDDGTYRSVKTKDCIMYSDNNG